MDQLRTVLVWLKAQHFWVLSGLVALIGLGCWWSAAGKLRAQYDANQRQITGEFSNLDNLRNQPFLPNQTINERQIDERKKQASRVEKVWEDRYARQRERVLDWLGALGLSKAFRDHVEKHEFGDNIPPNLRQHFTDYVDGHFKKLPEKVGARELVGTTGSYGGGSPRRGPSEFMGPGRSGHGLGTQLEEDTDDYLLEWEDQAIVRDELYFGQRASNWRIWWTLENLWAYHTLLDVIRNTNDAAGATRMSNAAVRTIISLEVGQRAAPYSRTPNRIYKLPTAPSAGSEMESSEFGPEAGARESMPMPGGPREFSGPGGMSDRPMTDEEEAAVLLSHRYLGEDGRPIPAGDGGGSMAGDPYGAEDGGGVPAGPIDQASFGKEYKRLPVRIVLEMDQRHLPQLIAECATQPLQIEVQEVRINPPDLGGPGGMGGMQRGGGLGGASLFPDRTGIQQFNSQPHMATVVVQGVIYIFKKPDRAVLETPDDPALAVSY